MASIHVHLDFLVLKTSKFFPCLSQFELDLNGL